ncbi:hypothetical protein JXM83_04820 [Candidatus Woesearchaeota archaeon]|nr:hypothetical protein [Candidatus Woesearchaeota archaeon]
MTDIDVDELIENHNKIMKGPVKICKKCTLEMKKTGVRMSMNINYDVFRCPKCGKEELVYKGPAD